jgi:hypothetical protein
VQISGERAKQESYPEKPKSRGSKNDYPQKKSAKSIWEDKKVSKRILWCVGVVEHSFSFVAQRDFATGGVLVGDEKGKWGKFLADYLPEINVRSEQRWRQLAAKATHVSQIQDSKSVRQAYIAAGIIPEPEPKASKGSKEEDSKRLKLWRNFIAQQSVVALKVEDFCNWSYLARLLPHHFVCILILPYPKT